MIPVYVREAVECNGVMLGNVSVENIPDVLEFFENHEVYIKEKGYHCKFWFSQLVRGDIGQGVVFEIVVAKVE